MDQKYWTNLLKTSYYRSAKKLLLSEWKIKTGFTISETNNDGNKLQNHMRKRFGINNILKVKKTFRNDHIYTFILQYQRTIIFVMILVMIISSTRRRMAVRHRLPTPTPTPTFYVRWAVAVSASFRAKMGNDSFCPKDSGRNRATEMFTDRHLANENGNDWFGSVI